MRGRVMRGRARSDAGFTLVEAVVALLLLGLALVPMLGALSGDLRAERALDAHRAVVALAEERMTALSLLPVDSLPAYLAVRRGAFPAPFAAYRWSALLRPLPESPAVVQAAVRVTWDGGEYGLETFFHRPEMLPNAPAPADSAVTETPGSLFDRER